MAAVSARLRGMDVSPSPQILVLDAGGQYCHLIARKVRDLGVYAEVRASDTPAAELRDARGLIISGGPASVYEQNSPQVDPAIFELWQPVLGICYGLQLMALHLGGKVQRGERGEYGFALLDLELEEGILAGVRNHSQIWMSHRDTVTAAPPGFRVIARTADCQVAAAGDAERGLWGLQFHPEVVHTEEGVRILRNFVFDIARCKPDWDPRHRVEQLEDQIRRTARDRNIFFFVSGGVDSSVAFTLCLRALGSGRVRGLYVDTGLMREGETDFVRRVFEREAPGSLEIEDASQEFLRGLEGVMDPEEKRQIIGEQFVAIQQRLLESHDFLDGQWILGQGTIYPDTIESGGTKNAAVIKTHHNRVAGIQRLLESGRVIEPLDTFYKDEVREVGRELGLPPELLDRHPFPGPGLAIRCLCSDREEPVERLGEGWLTPVRSVGVQGDLRSYRSVLAIERERDSADLHHIATELINQYAGINRVIVRLAGTETMGALRVFRAAITQDRLARLRRADAIVRRRSKELGYDSEVWQFPAILIPLGTAADPDSVVLRPVSSVDGMTAQSSPLSPELEDVLQHELLALEGINSVFLDLTHKPPGTIEWE